jgi:formylglycine-generating enzyme required for sulfatase activity
MALVDGDYCTEIDLECTDETRTPWNGKTVCRRFREPSVCRARAHKRFCVDRFEYPNRAGARPTVMNDFAMAQALCVERGRRLCTESEWTMACEGATYKPFPYGYARDATICRGDQSGVEPAIEALDDTGVALFKFASKDARVRAAELERLWQGVPSGSQPRCVSDYGVFDMTGNADEWVAAEKPDAPFDGATAGGAWRLGVRNQCRPKIYTHDDRFAYYYLSLRCCAEADGAKSDPRSPRQIARGERWTGGRAPIRDSWTSHPAPNGEE